MDSGHHEWYHVGNSSNSSVPTFISWRYSVDALLRFRGLRNSLGYFSHVKYLTIDIDIDIDIALVYVHPG